MPSDDRDQQLERALARHLRDATPDLDCPDAEILAAFHERTLALDEMTGWKNHIAGCTRCQETLALMEVTEEVGDEHSEATRELPIPQVLQGRIPEAPGVRSAGTQMMGGGNTVDAAASGSLKKVEPPRVRRQAVRWLVPVGAIAAAALVWVGVHERQGAAAKHGETQVAENRPALAPPLTSERAQPSQTLQEAKPASPRVQSYAGAPAKMASPSLQKRESNVSPPSAAPSLDAKRDENKDAAKAKEQSQTGDSLKGAQSDRLTTLSAGQIAAQTAPAPVMPPPAAAAPAPRDQAANSGQAADLSAPQAEIRQKKSADTRNALATSLNTAVGGAVLLRKVASSDPSVIVAPGDQQAWIVGAAGRVRHSADGGKTWAPQNTGVTSDLSTGSAPSSSVAWIVGKSGTILLSVDGGAHWKQLTSPITGDLGGVHAADALHATIWDEGNRKSYSTSDGGATWTPAANE
jgi:hypothetical protein